MERRWVRAVAVDGGVVGGGGPRRQRLGEAEGRSVSVGTWANRRAEASAGTDDVGGGSELPMASDRRRRRRGPACARPLQPNSVEGRRRGLTRWSTQPYQSRVRRRRPADRVCRTHAYSLSRDSIFSIDTRLSRQLCQSHLSCRSCLSRRSRRSHCRLVRCAEKPLSGPKKRAERECPTTNDSAATDARLAPQRNLPRGRTGRAAAPHVGSRGRTRRASSAPTATVRRW